MKLAQVEQTYECEPLFRSAHHALIFAFNYAGQQSPRTPMTGLLHRGGIGSGKGLHGIDGAAQAGIILAEYAKLEKPHQHILRVRFGKNIQECACCGHNAPCMEWTEAVDALSRYAELDGVHRGARHLIVEKVVCGLRGVSVAAIAGEYRLIERTLQQQTQGLRRKLERLESAAMTAIDELLRDAGIVGEQS